MVSRPTVSACLLTYKRAAVLPRTITDLLTQTYTDFELIINDDCSPDNTAEVCREFERADSRVRYVRNEHNLRYAGNQNAAVNRARGKYVAFIHDGDRYSPHLLQRWVEALEANPNASLVFNAVNVLDHAGEICGGIEHGYPACTAGLKFYDHMLTRLDSPIFGIVMARRDALIAAGQFDPSLPFLADVDMWFRLLLKGDIAYVPARLFAIYPREKNHPNAGVNWRIRAELAKIYRDACDRRCLRGSAEWRLRRRQVDRALMKADARSFLGSLARFRWDAALKGVPSILNRHLFNN